MLIAAPGSKTEAKQVKGLSPLLQLWLMAITQHCGQFLSREIEPNGDV
jgi:hypothetical protein